VHVSFDPAAFSVMAGLVPAIHVFLESLAASKTWMPGTRPGMTQQMLQVNMNIRS
jgi:hypothetical protein